jgi:hypothetical protein
LKKTLFPNEKYFHTLPMYILIKVFLKAVYLFT